MKAVRTATGFAKAIVAEDGSSDALFRYRKARQDFFARHGGRWPGTVADEFDLLAPLDLSRSEADEILNAAGALGRIYERAAQLVRRFSDAALSELGVPEDLLQFARCSIPGMADCVVGRFDLARTDSGYKLLEFNPDAPGLIVEAFSVNAEVCRDAGKANPNHRGEDVLVEALSDAVQAGVEYTGRRNLREPNFVIAAGPFARDAAMAQYLCGLLAPLMARSAPVAALSIDSNGIYDPEGRRIDVLYRVFPLRYIRAGIFQPKEVASDRAKCGTLQSLVENRRLALINPPFSLLLESKALQAVIWNLAESGSWFTAEERQIIARYFLPTYLDLPEDGAEYVVKPAYGAEGDSVRVMAGDGRVITRSARSTHSDEPMVYQKRVPIPALELMTEFGPRRLHLVTSCFLISGTPAGICVRAGEEITDESAWVLPTCISSGRG
ncbi:MAG TPA: glutathionylspermidine synthase family protein [Terracidiphilus sp.]|nr:glutathionylspermidine synthase family protein [Terracidiphilus sp.]